MAAGEQLLDALYAKLKQVCAVFPLWVGCGASWSSRRMDGRM